MPALRTATAILLSCAAIAACAQEAVKVGSPAPMTRKPAKVAIGPFPFWPFQIWVDQLIVSRATTSQRRPFSPATTTKPVTTTPAVATQDSEIQNPKSEIQNQENRKPKLFSSGWLDENFFSRVNVSGRRVLGYHMQNVDGDRDAYNNSTYYGQGGDKFTDNGHVHVDGRNVLGLFNFQLDYTDNRFNDPDSQRFSIDYNRGPVSVSAGDIRGSLLNTNSFASFNRSLKGVSAGYKSGRLALKGVRSEAKGSATTVSIRGDNSVGPYYLRNGRIVQDSLEVRVDGQDVKLLQDYTVNYDTGTITFNSRIIPPTSTIVVTYEALGQNGGEGTIEGYGASYDFGRFGTIGLTNIEQKPTGSIGLSTRTDLFQGFGDPSTPYFLTFEPLRTKPIAVKLQGVVQVEGVHYRFDELNPAVFYFLFFVPATSNIDVTYTPKPVSTVNGRRKVFGIDYRLPLGSAGFIDYNQATGELDNEATPMKGTARSLDVSYDFKGIQFRGSVRDVPNGFVGIETRGFNRNEKATQLSLESGKGPFRYGVSTTNSLIGNRIVGTDGDVAFRNSRATTARGFVTYGGGAARPSWSLEHTRNLSRTSLGESRLDATTLSTNWTRGRLSTTLGLEKAEGRSPITVGTETQESSVSLDTKRLTLGYDAGASWKLGARASLSDVTSRGDTEQGHDYSLSASYNPGDKLSVNLSHTESKSGEQSVLFGFANGFGLGYGGNGFSSGQPASTLTPSLTGTELKSTSLALTYKLSPRIDLAARVSDSLTSGGVSANAQSRSYGLDLDWNLGRGHTTGLSLNHGRTDFIGSDRLAESTNVDFFLTGAPKGPWTYKIGASMLLTGGNGDYQQDSFGFEGSLTHRLNDRQRLGFAFRTGYTQGYLPQDDFYASLFYDYRIWENLSLVASYKWRELSNNDVNITSGAYSSSGLDIELAFDFAP